jgi:lipopolysaccharide/colanic/teichoic acid biosynthesis glycosyltransferase
MLGGEIMSQIMEQVAFDYPNFYTEVDASTIEETPTQKKPILDRKKILKSKKAYWVGRRTQDIILSSLALIVLSPFMLLVALIIYIDDPHGSPIFVQERIGRGGKPFKFYKFRSMVVDAEDRLDELQSLNEKDGPAFKIHDDPRITHVGKFIRKTSIDELPQLVNVLKGDMSICGEGCIIGTTRKTLDLARVLTA